MWLCSYSQWSDNSKVLLVIITLFSSITLAQLYAAIAASSSALLVDAVSMLVDTATYMGNLSSELFRDALLTRGRCELLAPGASLMVLMVIALWGISDGLHKIDRPSTGEPNLEARVVFGFGLAGLASDLLSLYAFKRWGTRANEVIWITTVAENLVAEGELLTQEDEVPAIRWIEAGLVQRQPLASINMCSAFLHVGADFLRSLATTVEGIAVIWFGFRGSNADGIATLVVSGTILAGSCCVAASLLRQQLKTIPSDKPNNTDSSQNNDIVSSDYCNDYTNLTEFASVSTL